MSIVRFIPRAEADTFSDRGWVISEIIGGSHGIYSAVGVLIDPNWRQMVKPARRRDT